MALPIGPKSRRTMKSFQLKSAATAAPSPSTPTFTERNVPFVIVDDGKGSMKNEIAGIESRRLALDRGAVIEHLRQGLATLASPFHDVEARTCTPAAIAAAVRAVRRQGSHGRLTLRVKREDMPTVTEV